MKVTYKKKTLPRATYTKSNQQLRKRDPVKGQAVNRRTVVRVSAVPRRTVRGC